MHHRRDRSKPRNWIRASGKGIGARTGHWLTLRVASHHRATPGREDGKMNKVRIDRRWLPLNALRAFEAVAGTAASLARRQSLQISQSALSRHVISIEKLIGVQLFERRPHALVLTKAGQHLLPAVTKAFDRLEHSLEEIHGAGARRCRTLRVQMPPTLRGARSRCRSCAISAAPTPKSRSTS